MIMRFDSSKWDQVIFPGQFTYFEMFCVLGNIELALRHPDNNGPSSARVREIGRQIAERLVEDIEDLTPEVVAKTRWKETFGLK